MESEELFREWRATRRRALRNKIVEHHMGFAVHVAGRFRQGGRPDDDLQQVAFLGLVKAVERFDPDRGVPFTAFAGPTIEGEIKRHFRDRTWPLRVPRSAQELHLEVTSARERLSVERGRAPTVDELAEALGRSPDEVLVGLTVSEARTAASIEKPSTGGDGADGGTTLRERLADTAPAGFGAIDDSDEVARLLAALPERERRIVRLRFFEGMSQDEIGQAVGLSQMHVSRLLRSSLDTLRARLVAAEPAGG